MHETIAARFTRDTLDREDGVVHYEGDQVELSRESFERWERRGAVEALDVDTPPTASQHPPGGGNAGDVDNDVPYGKMTVAELKSMAEDLGLDVPRGIRKAELVAMVEEAADEADEDDAE